MCLYRNLMVKIPKYLQIIKKQIFKNDIFIDDMIENKMKKDRFRY